MSEIAVYEEQPLTAGNIRAQVNLIQEVMKTVMQEGQHYGKIPGCGDKPTLLKPGAEKIMATFRLSADPDILNLSSIDIIRYQVKCKLSTQSGIFKGAGIGECSSEEEKYKWRLVVSEAEWNATSETHRRIAYKSKWESGKKVPYEIKQIRTNPYDLANTILKMAKKRALVDAVLTVTAASDIFTQDIEDMPEELFSKEKTTKAPLPPSEPEKKKGLPTQTHKDAWKMLLDVYEKDTEKIKLAIEEITQKKSLFACSVEEAETIINRLKGLTEASEQAEF